MLVRKAMGAVGEGVGLVSPVVTHDKHTHGTPFFNLSDASVIMWNPANMEHSIIEP